MKIGHVENGRAKDGITRWHNSAAAPILEPCTFLFYEKIKYMYGLIYCQSGLLLLAENAEMQPKAFISNDEDNGV